MGEKYTADGGENRTTILGRSRSKCAIILNWRKYEIKA